MPLAHTTIAVAVSLKVEAEAHSLESLLADACERVDTMLDSACAITPGVKLKAVEPLVERDLLKAAFARNPWVATTLVVRATLKVDEQGDTPDELVGNAVARAMDVTEAAARVQLGMSVEGATALVETVALNRNFERTV